MEFNSIRCFYSSYKVDIIVGGRRDHKQNLSRLWDDGGRQVDATREIVLDRQASASGYERRGKKEIICFLGRKDLNL